MPNPSIHTHCQVAQDCSRTQTCRRVWLPNRTVETRKELPRNEKHENLTKCIVNALSSYFQIFL